MSIFRGERGRMGDHGQDGISGETGEAGAVGETGAQGETGRRGERGERGRSLNRWQTLALFGFVVVAFLILAVRTEIQTQHIEAQTQMLAKQQAEIQLNASRIIESRYQGCLGGLAILDKFNKQMEELARIEQTQTLDKKLAARRIKAYRSGLTLPLPVCTR